VEKYCGAGQAIDDNIRFRISCWITEVINTSNMKYSLLFHSNIVYVNAAQSYVNTYFVGLVLTGFVDQESEAT
jgi:hypothetical protein